MTTPSQLADLIKREFLYQDYDFIMAITGMTGAGKSTLATQIGKAGDPNFTFQRNLAYSRQQLFSLIDTLPEFSFIQVDEAISLFYNRNFMQREQKELLTLLQKVRYRHMCVMLCIPNIWDLDKNLRENQIKSWCHVYKRQSAYIFNPDQNPFLTSKWHQRENAQVLRSWNKGRYDITRSSNFLDVLNFTDLNSGEKREYLVLKEALHNLQAEEEAQAANAKKITAYAKVWRELKSKNVLQCWQCEESAAQFFAKVKMKKSRGLLV